MARSMLLLTVCVAVLLSASADAKTKSPAKVAQKIFDNLQQTLIFPCDLISVVNAQANKYHANAETTRADLEGLLVSRYATFRVSLVGSQSSTGCTLITQLLSRANVNTQFSVIKTRTVVVVDQPDELWVKFVAPGCTATAFSGAPAICAKIKTCSDSTGQLDVLQYDAFINCVFGTLAPTLSPIAPPTPAPTFPAVEATLAASPDDPSIPVLPFNVNAQYTTTTVAVGMSSTFTDADCLGFKIQNNLEGGFFKIPSSGGTLKVCQLSGDESTVVGFTSAAECVLNLKGTTGAGSPVPYCTPNETPFTFHFVEAAASYRVFLGDTDLPGTVKRDVIPHRTFKLTLS